MSKTCGKSKWLTRLTLLIAMLFLALAGNLSSPAAARADGPPAPPAAQPAAPGNALANEPAALRLWLKEGTILTYATTVWYLPGTAYDYREDANGDCINSRTGQHVTREARGGEGVGGWSQEKVVAVDGDKIFITWSNWQDMRLLGSPDPIPDTTLHGRIASVSLGDLHWKDPVKLAAMQNDPAQHLYVESAVWKIGDRTYNCIRIQKIAQQEYTDAFYDKDSGCCVHWADLSAIGQAELHERNETPRADMMFMQGNFLAVRTPVIPWSADPMPTVLQQMKSAHFQKMTAVRGPFAPRPALQEGDISVLDRGSNWIRLGFTGQLATPFYGPSQFGSLWIGASAAKLKEGQVLDDDPITHVKTTVLSNDGNTLVLESANASAKIDYDYDLHTGLLTNTSAFFFKTKIQTSVSLKPNP